MKKIFVRFSVLVSLLVTIATSLFTIAIGSSNFALAFDCEKLRSEISAIPETDVYNSKFNKSHVKWFELKQCDGQNFVVKVRARFKHYESIGFATVKIADWAFDFDLAITAQGDTLNFTNVSDTYNNDGFGPDELRLAGTAFDMLAVFLGNPYFTTSVDRFHYIVGRINFILGDPVSTASTLVASAYTKVPR